ncbi:TreF [Staphylococcus phage CUB-A]|nr:TreF [Staphylococcus phage CUB-A]
MYSNSVYKIPMYNVYHNPSKKIIKEDIDETELIQLLFDMYNKSITQVHPIKYSTTTPFNIQGLINAVESEGNIIINRIF